MPTTGLRIAASDNPERDGAALAPPGQARVLWPVLCLLVTALVTTSWAARNTRRAVVAQARLQFESAARRMGIVVKERLEAHEQILLAGAGLFAASEHVSRAEWRVFVDTLQVQRLYPGIQGVGYVQLIRPDDLAAHIREVRREGLPGYCVWPEGPRAVYGSVVYLEPFTNRNLRALGYDVLSEPVRRAALERARDENAATLTGKVRLVQETVTDVQAGTLMVVPVYGRGLPVTTVAERRAALQGWVYCPYRMSDLMRGTLGEWGAQTGNRIRLQIFDGEPAEAEGLLYDSEPTDAAPRGVAERFTLRTPITHAGRQWTLCFNQPQLPATAGAFAPVWAVAGGGGALSLLLASLVHLLRNTRHNARRMAVRLTAELQRSAERLALATEAGGVGLWVYDVLNDTLTWDDQMFRLYGITRAHFSGAYQAWQSGVHPEDRQRGDEEIQAAIRGEREFNTEFRVLWPDGRVRHIRAQARRECDAAGRTTRLLGTNWDITDRKLAELALRESEERLHLLLNSTAEAIYGIDLSGKCTFCNNTCLRLLGYERPEDLLGRNMHWQIHAKRADGSHFPLEECAIFRAFLTGAAAHVDDEVLWRADDTWFWAEYWSHPQRRNGAIVGAVVTFIDITERKRTEAALRESEANFRTFFESMTDMVFVGTEAAQVLYTNPAVTRTLGYSAEELVTLGILDLHPAERREEAGEIVGAMLRGERDSCPLPLRRKDGGLVPVETRVWRGQWNGAHCIFGVSKNLTSEVEAQQRFERLFRNNPAPMALSTLPDRRFFDVNKAFLKVLGYTRSEVRGKTAGELGIFADPEQQSLVAHRLQTEGRVADVELQVRRKDGGHLDGLFSGEVILSQGKQYFLTVMVDITERKRAEAELLRTLVAERELHELKTTFVSMVSHEFRTPLSAIIGAAEMLEDYYDRLGADKRAECFQIIRAEVQRLTGMLHDVLLQGQLDAGRVQFQPQPVDVVALCRDVALRMQTAFRTHPPVVFEATAPPGPTLADASLLERVVSNLLTNAYKYSPESTPVRLSVWRTSEEWRIEVQDEGIGIPEVDQPVLFSAFRRGGNVGFIKGTGVGLYIVKKCAELQGGRVVFRSAPGKGSTFTLHLPCHPTPAA